MSEFKKYEQVEVRDRGYDHWRKAIFLCEDERFDRGRYVARSSSLCAASWDECRKVKPDEHTALVSA